MSPFKRYRRYRKAMDHQSALSCVVDRVFKREKERLIHIEGAAVYLRTNSPDISVAMSSLHEKEYDDIRCHDPKVIVDAGANIGTSSIFFAKKFPNAKIYAIEPEQSNFELLEKNIKPYPNILAIHAAIWGSEETREIINRDTGHWGYTVSDTANKQTLTGQKINCITVEQLMQKHGFDSIDLLKMDIEGGEKDVLENAFGWVNSVEILAVELHDRICLGCDRAFYLATQSFKTFEKHGEKVTAYRS